MTQRVCIATCVSDNECPAGNACNADGFCEPDGSQGGECPAENPHPCYDEAGNLLSCEPNPDNCGGNVGQCGEGFFDCAGTCVEEGTPCGDNPPPSYRDCSMYPEELSLIHI